MSGGSSLFSRSSLGGLRQTCQKRLIGDETLEIIAVGLRYDIIAELKREERQFLVDLFEPLFLVLRQVSAVVGKSLVGLGDEAHLLGVEPQLVALVIDEFHAGEEAVIEDDAVAQFREHGAHFLCDSVHLVVAVGFEHIEEDPLHAVQQQTGTVQRHDGILKGRFGLIIHDSVYLGFVLGYSRFESRQIVLDFHLVKSRYAIGCIGLIQQRIGAVTC